MSVFEQLGTLALASRMKQLSENLSKDVAGVYQALDIPFEPRWFTLFWVLAERQPLTITELAKELRQTHAAIVQITNLLEKKGLLLSKKDKNDERRRQVSISPKGKRLFEEVMPVLGAIDQANKELLQLTAPDFLSTLQAMEQALEQKSMYERIMEQVQQANQEVVIKPYEAAFKEKFYALNREWIETYFGALEPADERVLQNPEQEILAKGGIILFALHQKEPIATVVLQQLTEDTFLLSKLAVQEAYRRKGIGKLLLNKVRDYVASKGARYLTLYTSPVLVDSVNFYMRNGFVFLPITAEEKERFKRETIKMQLELP